MMLYCDFTPTRGKSQTSVMRSRFGGAALPATSVWMTCTKMPGFACGWLLVVLWCYSNVLSPPPAGFRNSARHTPERVHSSLRPARRVLPLRFRRQSRRCPLAVGNCLGPFDPDDGVIVVREELFAGESQAPAST